MTPIIIWCMILITMGPHIAGIYRLLTNQCETPMQNKNIWGIALNKSHQCPRYLTSRSPGPGCQLSPILPELPCLRCWEMCGLTVSDQTQTPLYIYSIPSKKNVRNPETYSYTNQLGSIIPFLYWDPGGNGIQGLCRCRKLGLGWKETKTKIYTFFNWTN